MYFYSFFFFFLSPFQISQDRYIFHAAKAHYIHAGSVWMRTFFFRSHWDHKRVLWQARRKARTRTTGAPLQKTPHQDTGKVGPENTLYKCWCTGFSQKKKPIFCLCLTSHCKFQIGKRLLVAANGSRRRWVAREIAHFPSALCWAWKKSRKK